MYIVIGPDGRYYTGKSGKSKHDDALLWSPYRKHAKRYSKRGWAEKAARRWRGQVEEVKR